MSEEIVFYHGTRKPFAKGGLLIPRSEHGGKPTSAPLKEGCTDAYDAADFVYMTTSEELAWVYAWYAPGRGKPKVVEVAPLGEVYGDPEHSADMRAYRCDSAVIRAVHTDPLIDEFEASSGWVEAS